MIQFLSEDAYDEDEQGAFSSERRARNWNAQAGGVNCKSLFNSANYQR